MTTYADKELSFKSNNYTRIKPSYVYNTESSNNSKNSNNNEIEIIYVLTELELFTKFIDLFLKYDPDFVIGFETEMLSIAYIF